MQPPKIKIFTTKLWRSRKLGLVTWDVLLGCPPKLKYLQELKTKKWRSRKLGLMTWDVLVGCPQKLKYLTVL
jgi:hypothetical protein